MPTFLPGGIGWTSTTMQYPKSFVAPPRPTLQYLNEQAPWTQETGPRAFKQLLHDTTSTTGMSVVTRICQQQVPARRRPKTFVSTGGLVCLCYACDVCAPERCCRCQSWGRRRERRSAPVSLAENIVRMACGCLRCKPHICCWTVCLYYLYIVSFSLG